LRRPQFVCSQLPLNWQTSADSGAPGPLHRAAVSPHFQNEG
jgi:hypothetical protein